ncbi:MAG: ParA family protein [Anaerolineales bacterium]
MTTIVAVANQKGGVGKTTTAVSLAHGLALKGKEVLLVDLDPQGQSATSLGLKPEPGAFYLLTPPPGGVITVKNWLRRGREHLWLIPGDLSTGASQALLQAESKPISHITEQLKPLIRNGLGLDFIIFDTAPSTGGIQERAIFAADLVIIPAATEYLAADGVRQIYETMLRLKNDHKWPGKLIGILPTFYDEQTRESGAALEDYRKAFGEQLVLAPIHRATALRECPGEGRTIFEVEKPSTSAQRAAQEYQAIVDVVLKVSR